MGEQTDEMGLLPLISDDCYPVKTVELMQAEARIAELEKHLAYWIALGNERGQRLVDLGIMLRALQREIMVVQDEIHHIDYEAKP